MYTVKDRVYCEIAKFYDQRIIVYNTCINQNVCSKKVRKSNKKPNNKKYTGEMTKSGKKLIDNRLTAWFNAIDVYNHLLKGSYKTRPHLPLMVTLTLSGSQNHDDKFIKRNMLQLFIKNLQYNFGVDNYFWKAENQKNGNIHFHLLFDKYIDYREIQKIWNRIQDKNGYLDNYKKQYNNDNPPSTHIKSVYKSNNKVAYMQKYVSKNLDNQLIEGSVFRFSKGLIKAVPFSIIDENDISIDLYNYLDTNKLREFNNEYATIIYTRKYNNVDNLKGSVLRAYIRYYHDLYMKLYPKSDNLLEKNNIN